MNSLRDVGTTILEELDYLPRINRSKDYRIAIIGAGRIAMRRVMPGLHSRFINLHDGIIPPEWHEALSIRDYSAKFSISSYVFRETRIGRTSKIL